MSSQPIIRKIQDSEITEAVDFHNKYFNGKRTTKHWNWEYRGIYPELSVFAIARNEDGIIGTQGMIPVYLNIYGEKLLTGKSENSLVDKKFKGILFFKLYSNTLKMSKEIGMNCIWGYTGEIDVWRKGLKFKVHDSIMYESVFIINPFNTLPAIFKKKWGSLKKLIFSFMSFILSFWNHIGFFFSRFSLKSKISIEFEIKSKLKSNEDIIKLFYLIRNENKNLIHLELDENYLNWRVYNNPSINYQTFFLYKGSELKAYCFFNKNKLNSVFISEFTFLDDNSGRFLFDHCLRFIKKNKVGMIYFFGNKTNPQMHKVFNLLKSYGFVDRKSKTALVIKNLKNADNELISKSENWYAGGLMAEGYMI